MSSLLNYSTEKPTVGVVPSGKFFYGFRLFIMVDLPELSSPTTSNLISFLENNDPIN